MTAPVETVIDSSGNVSQYWTEIWRYRELMYFLSWRDILVRYKQTLIGAAWAVIRPFVTMVVFSFVFGRLAKLPSDVPYPVLVYAAMLPWQFFASALMESSNSILENSRLLTKVYFPRLIVPVSSAIVSFVDFLFAFIIMIGMMAWYRFTPSWTIISLPFFLALAFAGALGAGLWFSALNVKYRDVRYVVPFLVQFGLFISPVGFSSDIVPESWRSLYSLNPLVGVIDGFRWSILGGKTHLHLSSVAISFLAAVLILFTGIHYFRTTERSFADLI
jgi:lipopolysaccharide transport system permease protein